MIRFAVHLCCILALFSAVHPVLAAEPVLPAKAAAAPAAADRGPWVQIRDEDGIKIFRRDVPGESLREFRGIGTANAGIPKLVALLADIQKMPEWTDNCLKSVLIEKNFVETDFSKSISEYYVVAYAINRVPWPLQKRDYILRSNMTLGPPVPNGPRHLIITSHNVASAKYPETPDYVRVPLMDITLDMSPLAGKTEQTLIDFTIRVDPGGMVPDIIVNSVSKSLPYRTLRNIAKMATSQNYNREMEKLVKYQYERN